MHYCLQEQINNAKPFQSDLASLQLLSCWTAAEVEQQDLVPSSQETTVLLPGHFPILFSLESSQTVGTFYSYLLQFNPRCLTQYNFFHYTIFKHSSTRRWLCGQRLKSFVLQWKVLTLTQFKLRFAKTVMAWNRPFCPRYQRPQHLDSLKVRMIHFSLNVDTIITDEPDVRILPFLFLSHQHDVPIC